MPIYIRAHDHAHPEMPEKADHPPLTATAERLALADWAAQIIMGNPSPWPLGDGTADPETASAFFTAEGIGPLCHHALQTAGAEKTIPGPVWELLCEQRRSQAAMELIQSHQDAQVVRCLAETGLRPLVLKGAAYANAIYPQADLRPRCDTDLLFPDKESAQKAWKRLEREGYRLTPNVVEGRFVSRQRTCIKPTHGGHALDMHWAISNTHTFVRALPYPELDQDAVPLPNLHEQARTLGSVHSLMFACLHLFGHEQFEQLPRLLWLYDIFLLSRRLSGSDWDDFSRKVIEKRVSGICRHILDGAKERFPMPGFEAIRPALAAAETRESFRPDRLKTAFSYHLHDLKGLDNWGDRLQWIGETLFPSPIYMLEKYQRTNRAWLPLLYAHRSFSGLAKRLGMNPGPSQQE